jgi:phage terminase large subunit-like protein
MAGPEKGTKRQGGRPKGGQNKLTLSVRSQHDTLWCDELAAWQSPNECWDMAMFGLRVGEHPQVMISTTPKPIPLVRELVALSKVDKPICVVTRASTFDNRANLAPSFLKQILAKYEGTRLGRQEILGEVIEESEGALWTRDQVEAAHDGKRSEFVRVVVAIDHGFVSDVKSQ